MPSYSIQFRRGTSTDHSAFTGELAEITVDITNNRIILHDGETPGGIPIAKVSDVPVDVGDLSDDLSHIAAANVPAVNWYGDRALVAGGSWVSTYKTIDYFDINTGGTATDWGELPIVRTGMTAMSDGTYAYIAGGGGTSVFVANISTTGSAVEFARHLDGGVSRYLSTQRIEPGSASDGTYGVIMGGDEGGTSWVLQNDQITFATAAHAVDHGDLTVARGHGDGGCGDGTYGLYGGGAISNFVYEDTIDYLTIASAGNSQDFGDLTIARRHIAALADETRGVFSGGTSTSAGYLNRMDYVTIASPGHATDFGDLIGPTGLIQHTGTSNDTYGVFTSGKPTQTTYGQDIHRFTIQTLGNTTDIGDLTQARERAGATSGNA